jgi:hypothetical protein
MVKIPTIATDNTDMTAISILLRLTTFHEYRRYVTIKAGGR